MFNLDINPKMKINLPSQYLNRVVRLAPQTYTFEEITGDLAEETRVALASSKIEAAATPSIEPEDFETAYQWFIS